MICDVNICCRFHEVVPCERLSWKREWNDVYGLLTFMSINRWPGACMRFALLLAFGFRTKWVPNILNTSCNSHTRHTGINETHSMRSFHSRHKYLTTTTKMLCTNHTFKSFAHTHTHTGWDTHRRMYHNNRCIHLPLFFFIYFIALFCTRRNHLMEKSRKVRLCCESFFFAAVKFGHLSKKRLFSVSKV